MNDKADKVSPKAVNILQRLGTNPKRNPRAWSNLYGTNSLIKKWYRLCQEGIILPHRISALDQSALWSFGLMAQPNPCVICLTPLANYTTLKCCGQPCHVACVTQYHQNGHDPPMSSLSTRRSSCPSMKSSMKNGKKTRSLSSMSRPIGKTILCGMGFATKTATPCKDSGENCARSLWAPPQNPLLSGAHQNPSHCPDENLHQLLV